MLTVVSQLFTRRPKPSQREKDLNNQVDRLEFELAKVRREREAIEIRLKEERQANEKLQMHNYPASQWPTTLDPAELFNGSHPDAIQTLLTDLTAMGHDVSAQWTMHAALLDVIAKYQAGVATALASVGRLRFVSGHVTH